MYEVTQNNEVIRCFPSEKTANMWILQQMNLGLWGYEVRKGA